MTSTAIVLGRDDASWRQAHEALVRIAKTRAGLDFEEGRWLLQAHRSGTHLRLGYASFHEYTERLFGYSLRISQEKLRVAEALEELPETARSLQSGTISYSHARELTRVATPPTEKEWLDAAQGRTVREVEQLVSGHRPGSLPDDLPDDELKRHVLHLELSATVMATFREAMAKMRKDAGESLNDDEAILLLCRIALEGPKDPGRANHQIGFVICESCRRAWQQGRGELIHVGPEVLAMAECDAQYIGRVDAHVGAPGDAGSPADVGALHHSTLPAHVGGTLTRATQTIPPAIRRLVFRRDAGKCRVPGCRHAVFTEPHHLNPRSEHGSHHPDNLCTLCSAHHLAVHEGRLLITGSASSVLYFTHADGTPYGSLVAPGAADARANAFQALKNLGFREGDAKRALAKVPPSVFSTQELVRQALRELVPQQ